MVCYTMYNFLVKGLTFLLHCPHIIRTLFLSHIFSYFLQQMSFLILASLFLYTLIDSLEWICAAMHVTYMFISGYFHVYHVNPCALCIRVDTVYREQHSYFLSCFSFKIAKNNCTCTYFNLEFCNFFYLIFNNVFFKFIIIKNKKNK